MPNKMIKGFVDVFMTSDLIEMETVVALLYVCKDVPAEVIHCHFPASESFLHKKKWLLNCSYNLKEIISVII